MRHEDAFPRKRRTKLDNCSSGSVNYQIGAINNDRTLSQIVISIREVIDGYLGSLVVRKGREGDETLITAKTEVGGADKADGLL